MRLTVSFPSENHRKRGHAHYKAICEAAKKLRRFPERKAKIKAICRFAVMPICRRGQLLFCSTRIRKGQAKLLLLRLLLQLVHLVAKSMSRCLSPSLSLSIFNCIRFSSIAFAACIVRIIRIIHVIHRPI